MTRRELMAAFSAAGLALAAPRKLDHSRFAVLTDEVARNLDSAIEFARQYKLSWVELRTEHGQMYDRLPEAELKEARAKLSDHGLRVSFLNSAMLKFTLPGTQPVDKETFYEMAYKRMGLTPESMYRDRIDDLKRVLDAAHALGVNDVRSFAFWRVAEPGQLMPQIVDVLSQMGEVAHQAGCRILLENEMSTNIATSGEVAAFFAQFKGQGVGLNWDPQNAMKFESNIYPRSYKNLPKDKIGNVQMKAEGLIGPGNKIDWGAIFEAMQKDGYTGRFGLETHTLKGPAVNIPASHACMRHIFETIGEKV